MLGINHINVLNFKITRGYTLVTCKISVVIVAKLFHVHIVTTICRHTLEINFIYALFVKSIFP